MKRFILVLAGFAALMLTACVPSAEVAMNVVPTLISVKASGGQVVLQGRYFGRGQEGSHVLVAADADGEGGAVVPSVTSWNSNRIVFSAPSGLAPGFVYVVVDGVRSNGLPADLN